MTAVHDPIIWYPSDTWEIRGRLVQSDGQPLPIPSDAILRWKLENKKTGSVALSATQADAISVVNADTGEIMITIPPEQTATVAPGIYVDQMQVEAEGITSTQWTGTVDVKKSFFVS